MKETHLRSLTKAVSWRLFATIITMFITFFITHQLIFALYVGIIEFFSKILLFYMHERIWEIISFGKKSNNHVNLRNGNSYLLKTSQSS